MSAPATAVQRQPGQLPDHQVRAEHHVRIFGRPAGRPMLFLQGFSPGRDFWRGVTPHFESENLVVLVDQTVSEHRDPAATALPAEDSLHRCAEDLLELLQTLDLHDVVVVAHAVSAVIGALAADQDPSRIGALALTVPPVPAEVDPAAEIPPISLHAVLDRLDDTYLDCSAAVPPEASVSPGGTDPGRLAAQLRVLMRRPVLEGW